MLPLPPWKASRPIPGMDAPTLHISELWVRLITSHPAGSFTHVQNQGCFCPDCPGRLVRLRESDGPGHFQSFDRHPPDRSVRGDPLAPGIAQVQPERHGRMDRPGRTRPRSGPGSLLQEDEPYYKLSQEAYEKALALQPKNAGLKAAVEFAREQKAGAAHWDQARRDAASSYIEVRKSELAASGFNPTVQAYSASDASRRLQRPSGNQFRSGKPACRDIPVPCVPALLRLHPGVRPGLLHLCSSTQGVTTHRPHRRRSERERRPLWPLQSTHALPRSEADAGADREGSSQNDATCARASVLESLDASGLCVTCNYLPRAGRVPALAPRRPLLRRPSPSCRLRSA